MKNNNLQKAEGHLFNFGSASIRAQVDAAGMPWFNANDVCAALELVNPHDALAKHVDEDDLAKREVTDNLGRKQLTNHVNEPGLYALIFGSRKESAKRFKRWVTSEVLPAIRKNGYYVANATNPAVQERTPAPPSFRAQGHDYPSQFLEEDMRNVELLAQFAGLNHSDKLTLLSRIVWRHDKSFANVITAVRDRAAELANANSKDSPDAIEHSLSAR